MVGVVTYPYHVNGKTDLPAPNAPSTHHYPLLTLFGVTYFFIVCGYVFILVLWVKVLFGYSYFTLAYFTLLHFLLYFVKNRTLGGDWYVIWAESLGIIEFLSICDILRLFFLPSIILHKNV